MSMARSVLDYLWHKDSGWKPLAALYHENAHNMQQLSKCHQLAANHGYPYASFLSCWKKRTAGFHHSSRTASANGHSIAAIGFYQPATHSDHHHPWLAILLKQHVVKEAPCTEHEFSMLQDDSLQGSFDQSLPEQILTRCKQELRTLSMQGLGENPGCRCEDQQDEQAAKILIHFPIVSKLNMPSSFTLISPIP